MKKAISIAVILGAFMWLNMATKRINNFPCEMPLMNFLRKDTTSQAYYMNFTHDTLLIFVYKDTLLEKLSSDICGVLKDSCKMQGFKILIKDSTSDPAQWNSPYGKQVYFKVCP